jgi:hypothetical protein
MKKEKDQMEEILMTRMKNTSFIAIATLCLVLGACASTDGNAPDPANMSADNTTGVTQATVDNTVGGNDRGATAASQVAGATTITNDVGTQAVGGQYGGTAQHTPNGRNNMTGSAATAGTQHSLTTGSTASTSGSTLDNTATISGSGTVSGNTTNTTTGTMSGSLNTTSGSTSSSTSGSMTSSSSVDQEDTTTTTTTTRTRMRKD